MPIPLFLFYRGINKTQCRAGRHKHGLITFPSPFQAVVLDSCPQPCFPAHLRGWRGTANSCFIPKVCWHTRERVPFIMWSSSSNVIILPNVYITFWKGTWQTESSWDKWDCILERHPHMQYWWASWSLVDEVYSTGWVESLVVTSLGSAHRDGFYFLIEWGLCATKDGCRWDTHTEIICFALASLGRRKYFRLCIGLVKKFMMENTKWIFGPTQYFEVALWTQWYTF